MLDHEAAKNNGQQPNFLRVGLAPKQVPHRADARFGMTKTQPGSPILARSLRKGGISTPLNLLGF